VRPVAKPLAFTCAALVSIACASPAAAPPVDRPSSTSGAAPSAASRPVNPRDAERLQRALAPLIAAMNHPRPPSRIKVGIMDDPHINAANAGNGEFYVTRGLLEKANDRHLMGVLAHEVAHEDLNHVAKAERLATGVSIGVILLDQLIPGSRAITPIAGELFSRGYSRKEEYEADAHGAQLLERVGAGRQTMVDTLRWLVQVEGQSSGGFFSTHPGTADRIQALEQAR
jgi:Zn-dependent protease with chaperone function